MTDYQELLTVRDFIRFAVSQFNEHGLYFGHGTDNAWDDAIALTLHVLHLPQDVSQAVLDARLTQKEKEKLHAIFMRRIKERIPSAYLTNEAWFAGLSFYVDERVLIPRSPIAELIESHFEPWIEPHNVHHILDLCTGSGCIAIASANAFPDALVDASDMSDDALAVAKINVMRHEMADQVHLIHSDLFNAIPPKHYDIIVSNPPYVDAEDMADLPAEYHHEPKLGLAAGIDGLDIVKNILKNAPAYLNSNGILIVEVGNSENALVAEFPHVPFTWLEFERGGGGVFILTREDLISSGG